MEWIVTDDISRETWRRILEFSNIELSVEEIARRHGPINSESRDNYRKQARQVRVCALQAKEYFDAATTASLITRPNHAYYCAVSVASMMMLILGDGTRALDFLRTKPSNTKHGLKFSTGCTAKSAAVGLSLVENSFAEIDAAGQFANWYSTLPTVVGMHAVTSRAAAAPTGATIRSLGGVGQSTVPTIGSLVGVKRSILDLIKYLPDLSGHLYRYGIEAPRSRSGHTIDVSNSHTLHTWFLHWAGSIAVREALLEEFEVDPNCGLNFTIHRDDATLGAFEKLTWAPPAPLPSFSWPSCRETLNHDAITYLNMQDGHEIVDLYIIAYQLSMVARYYPDLWISCIESQCKAAKLIEGAVDLIMKKLPILALSILSPAGLTISTHREHWK